MNSGRANTLITAGILTTVSAGAQAVEATRTEPACTYQRCALSITPAWNGLALESGDTGQRVANLGFFWPRTLDAIFPGRDSAATMCAPRPQWGRCLLGSACRSNSLLTDT